LGLFLGPERTYRKIFIQIEWKFDHFFALRKQRFPVRFSLVSGHFWCLLYNHYWRFRCFCWRAVGSQVRSLRFKSGSRKCLFFIFRFYYFLYRIDRRPNFVKKCEIHHMLLNKIRMFFLWPGHRKKTVLLLSLVTLRMVAVAALMSFSGPSLLSFSPSSTHPGDLTLKHSLKKLWRGLTAKSYKVTVPSPHRP
jgi:hypothetical protein